MVDRNQKLDLLRECNDQQIPPREFMGIFCNRCRNASCVNAGWSGGKWVDRMVTQVDRLLTHPNFADPSADKFDPLRSLDFREVSEAVVIRTKADPWAGPQEVHLADPGVETSANQIVEDAVRALSASKAGVDPAPSPPVQAPPVQAPPVQAPPVQAPPRRNPSHFQSTDYPPQPQTPQTPPQKVAVPLTQRLANTPFPQEGMMIDGSPPATETPPSSTDPWEAPPPSPTNSKPMKVSVGSKIKMGG
jgi:hypothetical protein